MYYPSRYDDGGLIGPARKLPLAEITVIAGWRLFLEGKKRRKEGERSLRVRAQILPPPPFFFVARPKSRVRERT